ncbi:MAG: hypothetical protein K2X77_10435 [Candidatus Obscuribacterales bacterium]|nr:hypothetical protein [Candidatus Obscuribacterales bacterium]
MDRDIKDSERINASSQTDEAKSLHEAFASDAGLFTSKAVRQAAAENMVSDAKENGAQTKAPSAQDKNDETKADAKTGVSPETTEEEEDEVFIPETLNFPNDHKEKLQSLIEAEKIMPMLSPIMENQMDDLMADADKAGEDIRNRLSDDLEHFDGQAKLDRADNAIKGFRTAFYSVEDKAHKAAILKYLQSNSVAVPGELSLYPKLRNAIDELGKSQADPDYRKAAEIRTEAHNKLESLAVLKEDYAKHLAETERSGKALVMIVQAKEIRTEIDRRN